MELELNLYPEPPYDMNWSALFFGFQQKDVVDHWRHSSNNRASYSRLFVVDEQCAVVKIHQEGSPDNPCLKIIVDSRVASDQLIATVARMLRVGDSLRDFYYVADYDSVMSRLKQRFYGLKPTITPTVFEAVIIAVTEQQISLKAALTLRNQLASRFGTTFNHNGETYCSFPNVMVLATTSPESVHSLGFSRQRAESIIRVAQMQATGDLDFESLRSVRPQEAISRLMCIRGLGIWSAQYALVRGVGHLDIYPETDTAVRRAVSYFYGNGDILDLREVNHILSRWGSLSRLAEYYLLVGYELEKVRAKAQPDQSRLSLFQQSGSAAR